MQYYNIEIDEFNECLEDLYTLIKDYEVTTWDYNNFDIGEEEEEEEEEDEWGSMFDFSSVWFIFVNFKTNLMCFIVKML